MTCILHSSLVLSSRCKDSHRAIIFHFVNNDFKAVTTFRDKTGQCVTTEHRSDSGLM